MRQDPVVITWIVQCVSEESLRRIIELLRTETNPDYVVTEAHRSFPNGVEISRAFEHRVGDYFSQIRVVPGANSDSRTVRLVFHRLPHAERAWKDLMTRILQSIRNTSDGTSVVMESRDDDERMQPA